MSLVSGDVIEAHLDQLHSELAHIHAKLDRILALAGDKTLAAMVDPACVHEPGCLNRLCRKCGRQVQAPLEAVG